jgi:hypothetical protein
MTSDKKSQPSNLSGGNPDGAEYNGRSGGGDSGGGAYPNPHSGKKPKAGGFLGHGGQTEMAYHGKGRLGDQVTDENENAPAGKAGKSKAE